MVRILSTLGVLIFTTQSSYAQQVSSGIALGGWGQWLVLLAIVGVVVFLLNRRKQPAHRSDQTTAAPAAPAASPAKTTRSGPINLELVLGAAIGFALLVGITPLTVLGQTCYAVGQQLRADSQCLPPPIYFGAWIAAAGFVLVGLYKGFVRHD